MQWDIPHIFLTLPISTATIMSVFLSPEFRAIIYFIMAFMMMLTTIFFLKRKYRLSEALKKGIVAAFFTSAVIYAIHADAGWTQWLLNDLKNYGGLSTEEKLGKMDGGLYEFARQAKTIVTEDYQIYSPLHYETKRLEYFLLPLDRREKIPYLREKSKYIIVMADPESRYDAQRRVFTHGGAIITDLDLVLSFPDYYILKKR